MRTQNTFQNVFVILKISFVETPSVTTSIGTTEIKLNNPNLSNTNITNTMKKIIQLLLNIHANDGELWVNDLYVFVNGYKHKPVPHVQKALDQGLIEEYGNYFILTKEGQEIVDYTQRPVTRIIKDLNEMNARFTKDIQDSKDAEMKVQARVFSVKKKTVEYILGPICYHARHNFSDNN